MKGGNKGIHKACDSWNNLPPSNHGGVGGGVGGGGKPLFPKYMICLLFLIVSVYGFYAFNLLLFSPSCVASNTLRLSPNTSHSPPPPPPAEISPSTGLQHIVFGIAASASLWEKRREYIKIWWRPREMRGFAWLDRPVHESEPSSLPAIKISANTTNLHYTNRKGRRSAIRISRIVSEAFNLGLPDVRWFVMGDDDTVFVPDNLVRVLEKFDHRQPLYIGSLSESHLQNIHLSYSMAYGGGGFAVSRPLAAALSRTQDGCLNRYASLYGSDERVQACVAELGVPLTRHRGFHQFDVYGDLLGLLAAHPVTPLVSVHHLNVVGPVFPGASSRALALKRLFDGPVRLDSAAVLQQSICYDEGRRWTVSVSWGFVVEVVRGVVSAREMETPARTFLNWYRRADYMAYAFNTRPVARNPCQRPFVYYLSSARMDGDRRTTVTVYDRHREKRPVCRWNLADPAALVDRVLVYKKPDPGLWDRSPRRNCCRVKDGRKKDKSMVIDVGVCNDGEIAAL